MQVNSTVNSAMLGYQRAANSLDDAAQKLSQQATNVSPQPSPPVETSALIENRPPVAVAESINTELLNMQTSMYNGLAALQVLRTADDMLGTSIDVAI